MNSRFLPWMLCAVALNVGFGVAEGQRMQKVHGPLPAYDGTSIAARLPKTPPLTTSANALLANIPVWSYSLAATKDGTTYTGQIVGGNPFARGGRTTTVNVVIIPLIINITQGVVPYSFDPTVGDGTCPVGASNAIAKTTASPIFTASPWSINGVSQGTVTFPDAYQIAEFSAPLGYHLAFNVSTAATQTLSYTVPAGGDATAAVFSLGGTQCGDVGPTNQSGRIGVVNINTLDGQLQTLITSLSLSAGQFPLFVTNDSVISNGAASTIGNCCILGYHSAVTFPGQTYGIAEFDRGTVFGPTTADVSVLSHEVMEWVNDPSGNNLTPPWGVVGQVSGCQGNFETGDPLSGTLHTPVTLGGFTYHIQEQAYFSWFFNSNGTASLAQGGKFSTNGTFAGPAKACPPGGTN